MGAHSKSEAVCVVQYLGNCFFLVAGDRCRICFSVTTREVFLGYGQRSHKRKQEYMSACVSPRGRRELQCLRGIYGVRLIIKTDGRRGVYKLGTRKLNDFSGGVKSARSLIRFGSLTLSARAGHSPRGRQNTYANTQHQTSSVTCWQEEVLWLGGAASEGGCAVSRVGDPAMSESATRQTKLVNKLSSGLHGPAPSAQRRRRALQGLKPSVRAKVVGILVHAPETWVGGGGHPNCPTNQPTLYVGLGWYHGLLPGRVGGTYL